MKAFLSHSSKDKGYVESVASFMKPGTYELDSETFDRGILNTEAIEIALKKATLFVLFLSEDSLNSGYVNFEFLIARELYASGSIEKILVICLDETSFSKAAESLKYHNFLRKAGDSASSARLIASVLISSSTKDRKESHPFLNREVEIAEIQEQLFDHAKPDVKVLFISGNPGVGRRTLARKVFADQFPQVIPSFPEIEIEPYDGREEIFRKLVSKIRPSSTVRELRVASTGFQVATEREKDRQLAEIINSLLPLRESLVVSDLGGVLADDGSLEPIIDSIVDDLASRPHPPLTIIAPRMVPRKLRREASDIAYCAVQSLLYEVSRRLVRALLKAASITASDTDIDKLTELGEGYPDNYYRMVSEIRETSLAVFLGKANDFVNWKHRRSSEYLKRLLLDSNSVEIISILNLIPQADFEILYVLSEIEKDTLASCVEKLIYGHVLEVSFDLYKISPYLRVAAERDKRFSLGDAKRKRLLERASSSLSVRIEDGTANIRLLDTAILADIARGSEINAFVQALVLPSHYVWLCRRAYDRQDFTESIRLAKIGLDGRDRLSRNGKVAACRFLCLSAARIGDETAFGHGMTALRSGVGDNWTKTNIEFLQGFNERLKGNLPKAEQHLREALSLSKDNFSAARELAAVCAARGNLDDAEAFAREARQHAPDNAYVLDILISVLIRRHGRNSKYSSEIEALFDALEKVGDEGGRSFYVTRKAEFEHLWGNNKIALRLIDEAVKKTPKIFDVHRIRAQILIKDRNTEEAWKEISRLKEIVNARLTSERRANYRGYVETYAEYLEAIGQYSEAKKLFDDVSIFTEKEREEKVKSIEISEGYARR